VGLRFIEPANRARKSSNQLFAWQADGGYASTDAKSPSLLRALKSSGSVAIPVGRSPRTRNRQLSRRIAQKNDIALEMRIEREAGRRRPFRPFRPTWRALDNFGPQTAIRFNVCAQNYSISGTPACMLFVKRRG
jgi:hypothetical protein